MTEQDREMRRVGGAVAATMRELGIGAVRDPRTRPVKHSLWRVLTTVLWGLAAGCRSLKDTERLTKHLSGSVRRLTGNLRPLADTTMRNTIVGLSIEDILRLLHRQVRHFHRGKRTDRGESPMNQVSIDGKSVVVRGESNHLIQKQGKNRVVRLMTASLVSSEPSLCLDVRPIPSSTNETGFFADFIDSLCKAYDGTNVVQLVSVDAGMTHRANMGLLHARGIHYLAAVNEGQPGLMDHIDRLLNPRLGLVPTGETVDVVNNDKDDIRRVWIIEEEFGIEGWEHVRTLICVQRIVRHRSGDVTSAGVRYFISSIPRNKMSTKQWMIIVRNHWRIENETHGVADNIFGEDHHPWLYHASGMVVISILRRVVINMLAMYRTKRRNAPNDRSQSWADVIETVDTFLKAATDTIIEGLRWPAWLGSGLNGSPPRPRAA